MYGFRVFEVHATRGATGRDRLPLEDPLGSGVTFIDRTGVLALDLVGKGLLTGVPHLIRPQEWVTPDPTRGEPQIEFSDMEMTPQGHLFLQIRHGRYGDFDSALGDDGEVDLRKRAPVREYRALLLAPASGKKGLLAVEEIDRRCPVSMIVNWLGYAGFKMDPESWVRLKVQQIADRERVRQMIRNAEQVTAELSQKQVGAPGRRPVQRRLTTQVVSELGRENAIKEALSWLSPDENRNAGDYVLRIESIAGFEPDDLDRAGLKFNSGAIVVIDEEKKEKRLDPDSIRDKFTYELSQNLPLDDAAWIARVRERLRGTLSEGTDIHV